MKEAFERLDSAIEELFHCIAEEMRLSKVVGWFNKRLIDAGWPVMWGIPFIVVSIYFICIYLWHV